MKDLEEMSQLEIVKEHIKNITDYKVIGENTEFNICNTGSGTYSFSNGTNGFYLFLSDSNDTYSLKTSFFLQDDVSGDITSESYWIERFIKESGVTLSESKLKTIIPFFVSYGKSLHYSKKLWPNMNASADVRLNLVFDMKTNKVIDEKVFFETFVYTGMSSNFTILYRNCDLKQNLISFYVDSRKVKKNYVQKDFVDTFPPEQLLMNALYYLLLNNNKDNVVDIDQIDENNFIEFLNLVEILAI